MRFLTSSVMLLCLVGAAISPVLAGQIDPNSYIFTQQPWNVKGDVLILDVGSLRYQGNHRSYDMPLLDAKGCGATCARTPGCDAWAYCRRREGCGSGCAAYVASNLPLRPASDSPFAPNPSWYNLTTITSFGPWGATGNCQSVCDNGGPCTSGDAWPYGVCTLKKLPNPDKPEFWSTDAGEGWVSGFTKQPPECAGIPVRTCTSCLRSKDPSSCLECARTSFVKVGHGLLEGAQTERPTKADGCSTCYDSSAPAQCIECLSSDAPCAQCALMQPDPPLVFDVAACINCSQQHGDNFTDACIRCSFLGEQPQRVRQCMQCLAAMKPVACASTEFAPGCWNTVVRPNACAACASLDEKFGMCFACMRSSPFAVDCEACASLDAAKWDACYRCARSASHPGSSCADCLSSGFDAAQEQQCLGCAASPRVSWQGKDSCHSCQKWCSTYDTRAKCEACLGTPQDDYFACSCNT